MNGIGSMEVALSDLTATSRVKSFRDANGKRKPSRLTKTT